MNNYKYNEDQLLAELKEYVDATYSQHYGQSGIQTTEFIIDQGHGMGFCMGSAIKYIQRYGKKEGFNRKDLQKAIHYLVIMLHVHDQNHKG